MENIALWVSFPWLVWIVTVAACMHGQDNNKGCLYTVDCLLGAALVWGCIKKIKYTADCLLGAALV